MNPQQAAEIIVLLDQIAGFLAWTTGTAIVLVGIAAIEFIFGRER